MRVELELLAPARNTDIGIAAIDCGADAVYIAGPSFGARTNAGNTPQDIERLCTYAHRFGARVYVVVNTILYDSETARALSMMDSCRDAGCDAFIIQDMAIPAAVSGKEGYPPLFASTQCAIRTPEQARWLESCGFSRLILERQLTLDQIRDIRKAVSTDIEVFVHGALCVSYSGNCYLSEYLCGRSANRGECIQACRSLYDLTDTAGRTIARNKALLSLKDLSLAGRIKDLCGAGVTSFKIEGRLKGISYVRNVVRAYRDAVDAVIREFPDRYAAQSYGHPYGGFTADTEKTFNRGYTELSIDGKAPGWNSGESTKSIGKRAGTVTSVTRQGQNMVLGIRTDKGITLSNGDGLCYLTDRGIAGFRADICNAGTVTARLSEDIGKGTVLYRNYDIRFEKELQTNLPKRLIPASVHLSAARTGEDGWRLQATACGEDGKTATACLEGSFETARNEDRALAGICSQLSKSAGIYTFGDVSADCPDGVPFLSAAALNGLRRDLAAALEETPAARTETKARTYRRPAAPSPARDYRANVSNSMARDFCAGAEGCSTEDAYELTHRPGAELMRTAYCVRRELGMCPKYSPKAPKGPAGPLVLHNNGRKLRLVFDCARCEMVVVSPQE